MINVKRLRSMLIKEFIQVFRDPRMRLMIFLAPLIQLTILAFSITTDVHNIGLAVLDSDNSVLSRDLVDRFTGSGFFNVTQYVDRPDEAERLLDHGTVKAVLRIQHGFAADIQSGRTARAQLLLDGTDSNTAGAVQGYATAIIQGLSRQIQLERLNARGGRPPARVVADTRAWFNPNLNSRLSYLPGLMVTVLTLITLILTAMAIVREKEIGTIEQIMVTPLSRLELILGKTVPFALIGVVVITLMLVVSVVAFGLPVHGNLLLFYLAVALYMFVSMATGLLISASSATQQQALLVSFLYMMPMVLLSGFMFPISNMPLPVQYLTLLDPMRYFLALLRGILLSGAGFAVLWPQLAGLGALGMLTLTAAVSRFKKTLA
jgi:ABC-2 type transport system permease protein